MLGRPRKRDDPPPAMRPPPRAGTSPASLPHQTCSTAEAANLFQRRATSTCIVACKSFTGYKGERGSSCADERQQIRTPAAQKVPSDPQSSSIPQLLLLCYLKRAMTAYRSHIFEEGRRPCPDNCVNSHLCAPPHADSTCQGSVLYTSRKSGRNGRGLNPVWLAIDPPLFDCTENRVQGLLNLPYTVLHAPAEASIPRRYSTTSKNISPMSIGGQ